MKLQLPSIRLTTIKMIVLLLATIGTIVLLASCVSRYKAPVVRTTTSMPAGRFGAGGTTVTETPFESQAFHDSSIALFTRP